MAAIIKPQLKSAIELFEPSIALIQKYLEVYSVLLVVPFILVALDPLLTKSTGFLSIAGLLLTLCFVAPLVYAETRTAGGHDVTLRESFSKGYPYFWRLLGLSLLVGALVVLGFIAFIIPGLILARRYMLAPYFLVDRNLGISEAMDLSAKESKPFSWSLYGIMGIIVLIAIVSFFGVIGSIVSALLSLLYSLATAVRYFEIKKAYKAL